MSMSPKTPKQITHHCNRCGRKNERPLNPHPTPAIFGRKTLHTFGDTLRLAPYHGQIWPQYKGKANVVDLHLEVGAWRAPRFQMNFFSAAHVPLEPLNVSLKEMSTMCQPIIHQQLLLTFLRAGNNIFGHLLVLFGVKQSSWIFLFLISLHPIKFTFTRPHTLKAFSGVRYLRGGLFQACFMCSNGDEVWR